MLAILRKIARLQLARVRVIEVFLRKAEDPETPLQLARVRVIEVVLMGGGGSGKSSCNLRVCVYRRHLPISLLDFYTLQLANRR